MDELWIALIVAVIAPIALTIVKGAQDARVKKQDWIRQDQVAARLLETTNVTNGKLDVIHGLVNSTMTAAIQAELGSTRRELALTKENIALRKAAGEVDQPVSEELIKMTELRIAEIEAILSDRRTRLDQS